MTHKTYLNVFSGIVIWKALNHMVHDNREEYNAIYTKMEQDHES